MVVCGVRVCVCEDRRCCGKMGTGLRGSKKFKDIEKSLGGVWGWASGRLCFHLSAWDALKSFSCECGVMIMLCIMLVFCFCFYYSRLKLKTTTNNLKQNQRTNKQKKCTVHSIPLTYLKITTKILFSYFLYLVCKCVCVARNVRGGVWCVCMCILFCGFVKKLFTNSFHLSLRFS